MSERGLILINTGDGKGKTTAALGTALRAIGRGKKVLIVQFIKSGGNYGELMALEKFDNVTIKPMGKGFIFHNRETDEEKFLEHKQAAIDAWRVLENEVYSDKWDLVVLDEINYAIQYDLLEVDKVIELLQQKPKHLDVILTGRNAHEKLIALADTVTEMKVIKHAYQNGIKAKAGIEF